MSMSTEHFQSCETKARISLISVEHDMEFLDCALSIKKNQDVTSQEKNGNRYVDCPTANFYICLPIAIKNWMIIHAKLVSPLIRIESNQKAPT